MQAFEWANAKSVTDATALLAASKDVDPDEMPRPIGGGQDLLTTMKSYITRPPRVVNLKTIGGLAGVTAAGPSVRVGALTTLTDLAADKTINASFPGLVEAVHAIATPQIRNLGTVGGNLGQRPRCWYFRLDDVKCLKRGGDACYAIDGENKYHAIFNAGPCVMVHPSDLAPMLTALGAGVTIAGRAGTRAVAIDKFFVTPKESVRVETILGPGDVVTEVLIPLPASGSRSTYLKFKERESLDFAMASVAVSVDLRSDGTVGSARVVLGGVAPVPWPLPKVDAFLAGKRVDVATAAKAGDMAVDGATPLSQNNYKLRLVKTLVSRAILKATTV